MTQRISTTDTDFMMIDGNAWAPAADTAVQCDGASAADNVVVVAYARADASGQWKEIMTRAVKSEPIFIVAQLPFMKLAIRGNKSGSTVTVFTGEV